MLESGRYSTVLELAKALKLDCSYVARTLSLVNLPVGDFLYSGKLWTRVVQFYSLLCNGDEKTLRGSSFVIRCCSTIYTNFISEGHGTQSQRKTDSFAEATESREVFREFPIFCKSLCG